MQITYSKLLGGYIATIRRGEARAMIAVKPTRLEVLAVALERLVFIKR